MISAARAGDQEALAELVDGCRAYLLLVANQDLDQDLRSKVGASDLVQNALISAHRAFDRFEGSQRDEFLAWIRGILKHDLLEANRRFKTAQKRQIHREQAMDDSRELGTKLKDYGFTPGTNAVAKEEAALLRTAMDQLSPEHRTVIELRNWQELSFAEIGGQMERSEDAARKLWARAIVQLQETLKRQTSD